MTGSNVKYSYFCKKDERHPCITIAFREASDGIEIAYGVAVASPSEKQAMYKIGKCIAENRCERAIDGVDGSWGRYNGAPKDIPYALLIIQSEAVRLDMFGTVDPDDFKDKLQALRSLMPTGRHKIKNKK